MSVTSRVAREIEAYRHDPEFEFEELLLDVNEQIVALMESQELRRTDLADRLGVSRAFITQLLRGEDNVSLKTLVRVANALGAKFTVNVTPRHIAEMRSRWLERAQETTPGAREGNAVEQTAIAA